MLICADFEIIRSKDYLYLQLETYILDFKTILNF